MLIKKESIQGFDIKFYALPPDDNIYDSFEDSDDADRIAFGIESGEYVHFIAKITASKNGIELASDYLGSCIYESYEEFWNIKEDYCAQMVEKVVKEAKNAIELLNN